MCRYVLIAVVVVLIVLMVGAALVVQYYGWPGWFSSRAGRRRICRAKDALAFHAC